MPVTRLRARARPRSLLSVMHIVFFSLVALYLCLFHPQGREAVLFIFAAGLVAEILPVRSRVFHVAEILLLLSLGLSYWFLVPHNDAVAMYPVIAMAFTFVCLIPSMGGRLRYLLSCVVFELVWQGQQRTINLACLVIIPIGLTALAVDAWLVGMAPAQMVARFKERSGLSLLRWALLPVLIASALGMLFGQSAIRYGAAFEHRHRSLLHAKENVAIRVSTGLDQSMHIGDQTSMDRDARIAARVSWSDGLDPQGMVYLRAMALSDLSQQGTTISWKTSSPTVLQPAPKPLRSPTRWAWVFTLPASSDVVLHPDGGDAIDLDNLFADEDGNRYLKNLHTLQATYRADFDDGELLADVTNRARNLAVPPWLDALPWNEIEQAHWKEVSPQRAAVLICDALRERCRYALDDLPVPAPGPGGALRTFLFGPPEERRGHCQYFATSAVLLLRRAGHCARCVVGYASNEFEDHSVVFRGYDAHAWCEVVNSAGLWQRVDATPAGGLAQRGSGSEVTALFPKEEPLAKPGPLQTTPELLTTSKEAIAPMSTNRRWWVGVGIAALVGLILTVWLVLRRRDPDTMRMAFLQRQSDDLFRVAAQLGISLGPATTLSQVITAMQQRTGMDLSRQLEAHLAARYDDGPLPPPWPLKDLQQAGRPQERVLAKV